MKRLLGERKSEARLAKEAHDRGELPAARGDTLLLVLKALVLLACVVTAVTAAVAAHGARLVVRRLEDDEASANESASCAFGGAGVCKAAAGTASIAAIFSALLLSITVANLKNRRTISKNKPGAVLQLAFLLLFVLGVTALAGMAEYRYSQQCERGNSEQSTASCTKDAMLATRTLWALAAGLLCVLALSGVRHLQAKRREARMAELLLQWEFEEKQRKEKEAQKKEHDEKKKEGMGLVTKLLFS